jgi:hypothetical protein
VAEQLCWKEKLCDIFVPYGCESCLGMLLYLPINIDICLNDDNHTLTEFDVPKAFFMLLIVIFHYV